MTQSPAPQPKVSPSGSVPLSALLSRCADAVGAVGQGRSLTDALLACPAHERPGTQALSFTVLRRLGLAQALKQQLVPRKPAPWVDHLLVCALALACGDEYNAHTLVDQAVEATKRKAPRASGLVNAVLRRFLRERDDLIAQAHSPVARFNHPDWWIKQLRKDWPGQWEPLLQANQGQPPMTLRVNARQLSAEQYLERLSAAGISARLLPPEVGAPQGIELAKAVSVQQLPGFAEGDVSVQDASAQRAAPMLLAPIDGRALPKGARVLDACAAPGGKTAHLLELADLDVMALDADAQRLTRVDDTLKRLQLQAHTRAANAADLDAWWDGRPFDAILLDAPCSASGIVRRHPDVRWLRRPSDIHNLARIQAELLDALWTTLKPGGRLVYCTCSVFKAEGEHQIDAFLQRTPDARALPAPGHLLPVVEYPATDAAGHESAPPDSGDGFYYARLSKTPDAT